MFGEYIDVYDLTQAVEDEATVRVYYEARLAKVEIPEDVRQSIRRIKASPFIPRKNARGFVYDVATGTLREVEA